MIANERVRYWWSSLGVDLIRASVIFASLRKNKRNPVLAGSRCGKDPSDSSQFQPSARLQFNRHGLNRQGSFHVLLFFLTIIFLLDSDDGDYDTTACLLPMCCRRFKPRMDVRLRFDFTGAVSRLWACCRAPIHRYPFLRYCAVSGAGVLVHLGSHRTYRKGAFFERNICVGQTTKYVYCGLTFICGMAHMQKVFMLKSSPSSAQVPASLQTLPLSLSSQECHKSHA